MSLQKLRGLRVVVTRAPHQLNELADLLRDAGADVVELPVIAIADPLDGGAALRAALACIAEFDWLVLTSVNTVARVFEVISSVPSSTRVAAIGSSTSDALRARGVAVDLVPPEFVAELLLDAFPSGPGKLLLPRAEVARDVLPSGLAAKGWTVEVVTAYRTLAAEISPVARREVVGADWVTFTSSSTLRHFVDAFGLPSTAMQVASIGPITSATARELGVKVAIEAPQHTAAGLAHAITTYHH